MSIILLVLMSYLFGSFPTGKLVGFTYHIDIQKRGSGNIGFANVRRILGWRAGLITLAVDIVKGFIPTLIALQFVTATGAFWIGMAAVLGHTFPVWLRFKGGKGIATGLGVVACLYPWAAVAGSVIYIIAGLLKYRSSTASLMGIVTLCLLILVNEPQAWWQTLVMIGIASWTLRHNLFGTVKNYESHTTHQ